ncbi:hypothetical protein M9458_039355, partial [Cirrhinus mrigala]
MRTLQFTTSQRPPPAAPISSPPPPPELLPHPQLRTRGPLTDSGHGPALKPPASHVASHIYYKDIMDLAIPMG